MAGKGEEERESIKVYMVDNVFEEDGHIENMIRAET